MAIYQKSTTPQIIKTTTVNITTNFKDALVDVYVDGIKQTSITVAEFKGIVNLKGLSSGNHTLMFVYAGNEHKHEAQKPERLEVK